MFYSHEILTSQKHGVATVWLVATLGARSGLRKVTRKAILEVDVPGTCSTILDPTAPLALRLQASLLYGISRVYSQQCGYVLSDTRATRDHMFRAFALIKSDQDRGLDLDAGNAQSDQINVAEDPSLLDEFAFNFDNFTLGILDDHLQSSVISVGSLKSDDSRRFAIPALELGSGRTPGELGNLGDLAVGGESSSAQGPGSRLTRSSLLELPGEFDAPAFTFDDDFGIVDTAAPELLAGPTHVRYATPVRASAAQSVEQGPVEPIEGIDPGNPAFGDNDELPHRHLPIDQSSQGGIIGVSEQTEENVEAPQPQRRRGTRTIQADAYQELTNDALRAWNQDYLRNMEDASRVKQQYRNIFLARRNAAYFVFGQGIAGVGGGLGQDKVSGPLAGFSGHDLLQALLAPTTNGRKRSRSLSSTSSDEHARRVRARSEDEEKPRDHAMQMADDEGIMDLGGEDIEVGREAPPSLQEYHSSLPWNVSALRYGSDRQGSALVTSSLGGGPGGMEPGSLPRRSHTRSRLMSSSPLMGKGTSIGRLSALEIPSHGGPGSGDEGDMGLELRSPSVSSQDFNALPPMGSQAALVALDAESHNFFDFVAAGIDAEREKDMEAHSISFEKLLPPEDHRKDVAAQAFLHVLTLASRRLIMVNHEEGKGGVITLMTVERF